MAIKRYELTDEQWEQVKDLIYHSKMGQPPKDDRIMFNALLWKARSGAGWEDLSLDSTSVKVHQHSAGAKKGL